MVSNVLYSRSGNVSKVSELGNAEWDGRSPEPNSQRKEIEILTRCDPGNMRPVETSRKKEWIGFVLQQSGNLVGGDSIRVVFIFCGRRVIADG